MTVIIDISDSKLRQLPSKLSHLPKYEVKSTPLVVKQLNSKQDNPVVFNPLNAELNPICHLLALLGGATIVVVSRLRVNMINKRLANRWYRRKPSRCNNNGLLINPI